MGPSEEQAAAAEPPAATTTEEQPQEQPESSQPEQQPAEESPPAAAAAEEEDNAKASRSSSHNKGSSAKYVYDPEKVTLRFVFSNRDGLHLLIQCKPTDTVGEVKGILLSLWPEELPKCNGGGDRVRLICMGKGLLMPDSRTLKDCEVPVFKTHATPINVSVRPEHVVVVSGEKHKSAVSPTPGRGGGAGRSNNANATGQGCACVIL